ncbi:hypothetical protein [Zobellia galactanivorans]|uniref:Uncharacterized protein n=1 Tax=Zobellia galactanivorans (strain DSM 12802 / CCUG 47099 / CIP 106680 / NCIMB 13871 / Dsij) TaxID=63186 RepID=G0L0W2_ZOBGA|nr:hypothetical protein [Zobellia galactanivorans]CAZ94502.1 Conserved hypothetical protein [Zobellia galactanivorans]
MEKVTFLKSKWKRIKEFLKGHLDLEISVKPSAVKSKLINNKIFKKADDCTVIIISDAQSSPQGLIIVPFLILLFLFFLGPDDMFSSLGSLFITLGLFSLLILGIIYYFTIPSKDIILKRYQGTLSVPGFMWKKGFTIEFSKGRFGWVGTGGSSGNLDMVLAVKHPDYLLKGAKLYGHITKFDELLSFYVWYMDRNRPLPPGDAFDPYRERDFLRRKAEGFPPPLYKSYVPTPEATPEQQKEREQYWTDEQYTEKFEREEGSTWYDPQIHNDWEETTYLKPETKTPVANRYVKFIFNDGRIIYSQTNEDGSLYEPPESEDFEMLFVSIKKP